MGITKTTQLIPDERLPCHAVEQTTGRSSRTQRRNDEVLKKAASKTT